MCYSEFGEIIGHIARLDADVLSIEASRSGMEVLDALADGDGYPNDIGPGVYDIHSPRVPSADEIERLLELAEERVGPRPPLGEPGLRAQDPRLGRGAPGAGATWSRPPGGGGPRSRPGCSRARGGRVANWPMRRSANWHGAPGRG